MQLLGFVEGVMHYLNRFISMYGMNSLCKQHWLTEHMEEIAGEL